MIENPFFILGCVRSGTTLLRDLLKQHQNLICPEETHFFRWADPFGTKAYESNYTRKSLFKKHRELDRVDNFSFFYTLQKGFSRKELSDHYMRLFMEANKSEGKRWFDKTPQNVYGILLISGMYPEAKFIHIHRHPYNVVASLKAGRVMNQQGLSGAINFWFESMMILQEFKKGSANKLLEVSYEGLTASPLAKVNGILNFLEEEQLNSEDQQVELHEEKNLYLDILNNDEIQQINNCCGEFMEVYGYSRV